MVNHSDSHHSLGVTPLNPFPVFEGQSRFDVCVIGAGYTGLSASLHLAELGYKVSLVDAQQIGFGASGRNGGQLGYGMCLLQPALVKQFNEAVARELWSLSVDSVELFHSLCSRHAIHCDFKSGNMACAVTRSDLEYLNHHADMVESYGQSIYQRLDKSSAQEASGSSLYAGAIVSQNSGHLNPLKYVQGLAAAAHNAGVTIYEKSRVTSVSMPSHVSVGFDAGAINADFVVFACNGYLGNLDNTLAKRILPVDNYQAATEVLDKETIKSLIKCGACVWDTCHSVHYFRLTPDNRLIMGCGIGIPGHPPKNLELDCRQHIDYVYPQLKDVKIDYIWGGTLGGTRNQLPDVGRLSQQVLYAQGYTGHGVGLAVLTGKFIAQEIHGHSAGFKLLSSVDHKTIPGGRFLRIPAILGYRLKTNTRDYLTRRLRGK